MRVLVVQNFDGTGLGQLAAALEEAGAEIDLRQAHLGQALPESAAAHDAVVILGGGQNALADEDYPYIPALLSLARDFHAVDKAVLGICLGAQVLARAFGGSNQIGGASEFGWCRVALTAAGTADPVLGGAGPAFPVFQWHDDTFGVPAGAAHLAASPVAASQAFRLGRATYGIQFHFEADAGMVRRWNAIFADDLRRHRPDWPARFEAEAAMHAPLADPVGLAIARAWVATIRRPSARPSVT